LLARLLKEESGYSLVEVMVAIMILAIAIIPMVSMFDAGLRAALLGGTFDVARAFANEKLEETKALSFDDALARYPEDSTTDCNPGPPADSPVTSCTVETDYVRIGSAAMSSTDGSGDYATAMLEVTVDVQWSGGAYQTTGLIGK
jgi:prepilin-type N-terminal cleavage/methylation domain-containing protein